MITLPVVLIAAAVLLLLALLLGLFLQRRRAARATPPGPRTVADLVQQRAERDPAPAPADPVVEEPAGDALADAEASTVDSPATTDGADPEPPVVEEPSPAGPAPVSAARTIAPLGDDVPWRRAAQIAGAAGVDADPAPEPEPEPSDGGRVPALALLRRPSRRPLPADTRHPFQSSTPRLAVVPSTPSADVAEVAAPEPAEASGVEPTAVEPTGIGPACADRADAEPSEGELNGAVSTAIEPAEDDATAAEPTDVGPTHPEPAVDEAVADDPAGREQAEDERRTEDLPSGAVLPLVGSGLAAGAIVAVGAQVAAGRAGDRDAEPYGVDGDATRAEQPDSETVHNREIDVRGVADRPDPSHVDLAPVDDGPPEVDGSGGASDQDVPPAPTTDTVEPPVADQSDEADQSDDVNEPAEAQVAPDHRDIEPAAAVAAPAALAGAAALALTRDAPHPEPDDFPSTDPDLLFDSPPEAPAADEPTPDDVSAGATPAEAPRTWTTEAPAPGASTEAVTASEVKAEPRESPPSRPRPAESTRRSPRDPVHLAAEQAAADLALLRTFGDPSARPERAPIVALEGTARPESPRPVGAAQPVRFRAVGRAGTEVAGAAVALLDDRGVEVGAGRSAAGELTAPHPGAYVLVATAPDHQPGAVALAVGDAPVDADVLLVRSAALVGVVSGEDGPLAGARVTLVQDGEVVDVAETDADGAYLVADLASGEYAVSVAAAGCDADVVLVVVADESECVHDVELEPAGVPAG